MEESATPLNTNPSDTITRKNDKAYIWGAVCFVGALITNAFTYDRFSYFLCEQSGKCGYGVYIPDYAFAVKTGLLTIEIPLIVAFVLLLFTGKEKWRIVLGLFLSLISSLLTSHLILENAVWFLRADLSDNMTAFAGLCSILFVIYYLLFSRALRSKAEQLPVKNVLLEKTLLAIFSTLILTVLLALGFVAFIVVMYILCGGELSGCTLFPGSEIIAVIVIGGFAIWLWLTLTRKLKKRMLPTTEPATPIQNTRAATTEDSSQNSNTPTL